MSKALYPVSLPAPPAASRSRSRSELAQQGEAEASSLESLQEVMPEEVLVISLGSSPQTIPGMMSENEVTNECGTFTLLWRVYGVIYTCTQHWK